MSRIRRLKVDLVCLLETKVKEHKMREIIDKWFPGWKIFHNYTQAVNGRIWMLWNDNLQASLIAITDQSITSCVKYDSSTFFFSAIYGCNERVDRRRL